MVRFRDITGCRFSKLVAVRRFGVDSTGKTTWECVCDCGNTSVHTLLNLSNGTAKSCGCLRHVSHTREDLLGQNFGRLTVIERLPNNQWKCVCICGNEKIAKTRNLKYGKTKSCGCISAACDRRKAAIVKERNRVKKSGWINRALIRAKNQCEACGTSENLAVHHILPFAGYPEYRTDDENSCVLCHHCHWGVHRVMKMTEEDALGLAMFLALFDALSAEILSNFSNGESGCISSIELLQTVLADEYGIQSNFTVREFN